MPSRSKKARVASLLPLLFFRCSGVDIRADGLAPRKARGGRLGQPPDEKAKEERLRESRRAHLRIAFGNARAPCREPRQFLRFGESLRGAGGSAPSHAYWRRGGLTATKQTAQEKRPEKAGFSSLTGRRVAAFLRHVIRLDGGEYSPRSRGFRAASLPPDGGRRRRRRGGYLHSRRGAPGQTRPGAGEGGARARPIVSQMGTIGQQRAPRYRLE